MKIILTLLALTQTLTASDRTNEIFLSFTKKIELPFGYSYFDNIKTIEYKRENSISQSLNNSPSVVLRENTQNLGLTLPSIRGFSSNQTVVVYDGIKLPKDITSTYDLSILPSSIDRLYILEGGWSSVFGSNAEGGVIGIKTPDIKKDTQLVNLSFLYGSYNLKNYLLETGVSKNNISVFTSLENKSSDGFQENSYSNKNSLSSKIKYNSDIGQTTLNIFAVKLKRGLPSGTPVDISAFNGEREKTANRTTDWQEDENLFLSIMHEFDVGNTNNEISYSRNNLLRQAYQYSSLTNINTYSDNIFFKTKIDDLNIGFEGEKLTLKSNDYGNHYLKNYGYFINKHNYITDNFDAYLYLRYDDSKNYDNMFSHKAILNYYTSNKIKLSYSVAKSFRSPNFADIYGSSNFYYEPNPDIKPEKSITNELSFVYENNFKTIITAYYYDIDDKISVYFNPNTWWSKSVNLSKGYIKGVETDFGYNFKNFKFDVGFNIINTMGKNKGETYKKLAYSPDYKINIALTANTKLINASLNTVSVGKQYTGFDKTGKKIPCYTVSSLSLSKSINDITAVFNIENIFNERYATTADSYNGYYPANPRNYSFYLSIKF